MTKTLIQSGPCRFETRVTAERVAKRKVKVTVETQCPNMQKMFAGWVAENGDELDPYKFCMSRPGQDALHTYAAAHLPPHAACPVLPGLLRTVEAEAGLCVKADMSVKFLDED